MASNNGSSCTFIDSYDLGIWIIMVSGAYPQVQAFIKSDRPERYKGLTIKYVRGADPVIKLLDDEEDVSNKKISS